MSDYHEPGNDREYHSCDNCTVLKEDERVKGRPIGALECRQCRRLKENGECESNE